MKKMFIFLSLFVAVVFVSAQVLDFVAIEGNSSTASFHSEATIESFEGSTDQVSATIKFDPIKLDSNSLAEFKVDLISLDTGLSKRNKHMRENQLETNKYPTTIFTMTEILDGQGKLASGKEHLIKVRGNLDLHGVVVERIIEVNITYFDSGLLTPLKTEKPALHVVANFDVPLSDHDISRPQFLFLKVAEEIQLMIDVWAMQQ